MYTRMMLFDLGGNAVPFKVLHWFYYTYYDKKSQGKTVTIGDKKQAERS